MKTQFEVEVLGVTYPATYLSGRDISDWFATAIILPNVPWCIDLETYAHPDFPKTENSGLLPVKSLIRTLQMFDGNEVAIFDLLSNGKNSFETHEDNFRRFYDLLTDHETLIAHNALFETAQLQKYAYTFGCYRPLNIQCSMVLYRTVAHALIASEDKRVFKSDLKTVAYEILGYEMEKESQSSDWSLPALTQKQLEYCARDTIVPYLIYNTLLPKAEELGLCTVIDLNIKAQETIAAMQIHGIEVDVKKHNELIAEWESKAEAYKKEAFRLFNREIEEVSPEAIWEAVTSGVAEEIVTLINFEALEFSDSYAECLQTWLAEAEEIAPQLDRKLKTKLNKLIKNLNGLLVSIDSSKQVAEWLERNVPEDELLEWPKTEKNALKTDAFAFIEAEGLEVIGSIVSYKKVAKLVSTYGRSFADWFVTFPDGTTKVFGSYTLAQTITGRMSAFHPNLQNIPSKGEGAELRSIFTTRPGKRKFVTADLSQIEIRVAAESSRDPILLHAYEIGTDIHELTASKILKKPISEVTKAERKNAKAPNFLMLYLGGPNTLMKGAKKDYGISMSIEEAKKIVWAFREAYPRLYEWQLETVRAGEETWTVTTPLGKLRALDKEHYYNVCPNHCIQGGAAEIMLLTMIFVMQEISQLEDVYILSVVHDEISLDVPDDLVESVKKTLQECGERAMLTIFPEASLKGLVDIGVGENWMTAK